MSKNYYIIPIFVPQEGCPHKCVFCNQDRITGCNEEVIGKTVIDTVNEYLTTINSENSTVEVSFFGGTFTGIREEKQRELLSVAYELKVLGKIDKIRMSTRPDYINEYILTYLKEYKVDIIELGVQSLVEDVLKSSGRGHSIEDVYRASKLIKEYGFVLGHQIMPGLPLDNYEKDEETVKRSLEMDPEIVRIYPALVIKDTPMAVMYNRGDYTPYSLEEAVIISAKMYSMYVEAGVNVIRIGLQPTEAINENGDVIAGPFHPSFRELVEGYLISEKVKRKLKGKSFGKIVINSRDLSKLYASRKKYFKGILESGVSLKVEIDDTLERGTYLIL